MAESARQHAQQHDTDARLATAWFRLGRSNTSPPVPGNPFGRLAPIHVAQAHIAPPNLAGTQPEKIRVK